LISHDHYDHLDYPTITAIKDWDTVFIVPLGVGAHLQYWGVRADRIREIDWWDRVTVGELQIVMTPARHASGRQVYDQNATLWAGYALLGASHRVYFSGDTGLFSQLERIGRELGPFDLTMIEAGAYDQSWPDWHIGPEQAVLAHRIVRGETFFAVHWGLFDLANHGWTEPIERTLAAAEAADVTVVVPRPGQCFEPDVGLPIERWWPELPWRTATAYPLASTKVDALRARYD
jgi:L-ascorbate metabolism protein UlaG (beta-lactamase superfamily)